MSEAVPQGSAPDMSRPLAGLAVYTMFKGEATQLVEWCNFHLNAGADRLYALLDNPSPDFVASLPMDSRIHWEVIDQATWDGYYPPGSQNVERKQVDGLRWIAHRAVAEGHEYLAFIDADELLVLAEPFTQIADRFPHTRAITVPVREMWFAEGDDTTKPFGATLALRRSSPRRVDWTRSFGWRAQLLRNGLMGHDAGKSIYRLPLSPGDITVHRFRTGHNVELPATSGRLLHFDSGSVATWNAKWNARLDGSSVATGLYPQRLAQQRLFAHALRMPTAEQERLFRQFFSLDAEAQARLEADGTAERVDVRDMVSGPAHLRSDSTVRVQPELERRSDASHRVTFQFALVTDKRFVKPTFATMTSVLAQMGDKGSVRFVVLGDGLDAADVVHLRALEHTEFEVQVIVHDVTTYLDRDAGTQDAKRATFGRIYFVDFLPEQRTIYLDGDVLATRDFTELFELDLGNSCLAGVPDSAALRLVADPARVPIEQRNRLIGITDGDPLEYLNGGVLILDLDNPDFRRLALDARALVVAHGRAMKQRDQDALNIAFAGRKYRLDSIYNYMTQFYVSDRCIEPELARRKYDAADATFIHFSGKIKPWEVPNDEFYNGMYRRLVAEAEERVGVSCEFYFSKPRSAAGRSWTADRWEQVLQPGAGRPAPRKATADIDVVDLCDAGGYLRLSSTMYEFALAADLRLTAFAQGKQLFEVPLKRISEQQTHLIERVGPGVRKLPFDLPEALASCAGVARHVELAVTRPMADVETGFVRLIGSVEVLAAGPSMTPLLREAGVDGAMETLSDGWLVGWFQSRTAGSEEAVSLYLGGELVARRPPEVRRPDLGADGRIRGFRFNIARLLQLGYGTGGDIEVRVAGTNIPLRGTPLPVSEAGKNLRYDASRDVWSSAPRKRRPLLHRVPRRWAKPWRKLAEMRSRRAAGIEKPPQAR